MYRVVLINMPFAAVNMPSFALTQLKSLLDAQFGDCVSTEVCYLNQAFAHYIGVELYQDIAVTVAHHNTGLGEWFFRQPAFPDLPDNTHEYFQRYYPLQNEEAQSLKRTLQEKRQELEPFLDELIVTYGLDDVELVGFTSMFAQNTACFAMARKLKKLNPGGTIVMGGANCETPMGQEIVKNVEHIDFVFSGPSLRSFPAFVKHHLDQEIEKCHRMSGVFSKRNSMVKQFRDASGRHMGLIGQDLDIDTTIDLVYEPFLNTLKRNFPQREIKPTLFFETSRGCWWGERAHCTFCGLNDSTINYRVMSPAKAIKQLESLWKYSPECSLFHCIDNILPRSYFKEVLPLLDPPPDVTLFYEIKADLSEEDVQMLSKARVKVVQPGIEALATSTLKLMRKGTHVFQNLRLLRNCLMYDVYPIWNLLVGFPGESEDTYKKYVQDIPLLTHFPPPTGVYPVRFDRYSPYFNQTEQFGLDLHPCDYYEMTFPFTKESLRNFAYYFIDNNFGAEYMIITVRWIDRIRRKFDFWWNLWFGKERAVHPKLFFKDVERVTMVYDSRSGEIMEYPIADTTRQVLDHLAHPKRLSDLSRLADFSQLDLEREIVFLQSRGLIFQEDDRFISLVLPREPKPMSFNLTSVYEVKEKVER